MHRKTFENNSMDLILGRRGRACSDRHTSFRTMARVQGVIDTERYVGGVQGFVLC